MDAAVAGWWWLLGSVHVAWCLAGVGAVPGCGCWCGRRGVGCPVCLGVGCGVLCARARGFPSVGPRGGIGGGFAGGVAVVGHGVCIWAALGVRLVAAPGSGWGPLSAGGVASGRCGRPFRGAGALRAWGGVGVRGVRVAWAPVVWTQWGVWGGPVDAGVAGLGGLGFAGWVAGGGFVAGVGGRSRRAACRLVWVCACTGARVPARAAAVGGIRRVVSRVVVVGCALCLCGAGACAGGVGGGGVSGAVVVRRVGRVGCCGCRLVWWSGRCRACGWWRFPGLGWGSCLVGGVASGLCGCLHRGVGVGVGVGGWGVQRAWGEAWCAPCLGGVGAGVGGAIGVAAVGCVGRGCW